MIRSILSLAALIAEMVSNQFSPFGLSWWRHQMDTFSALLAICAGNSPVTGEFPTQRPESRSFDVFFDLCLNKRLSKQSWGWWFETLSRQLALTWKLTLELAFPTLCISNWKLNGISKTNISKVTLNATNERARCSQGARRTPRWARDWGKIVQWSMKAWSRKPHRGDLPMCHTIMTSSTCALAQLFVPNNHRQRCPWHHLKSNMCIRRNFKHKNFNMCSARLIR